MESQNKPVKIGGTYIHHIMYKLSSGFVQQYANTGSNRRRILGLIPRSKSDMTKTRQNKASEVKVKTTRNVLTFGT
jgi:hypothetical protein